MAKKRNTKLALASLMVVSAITPVAVSADTNGSVTTEAGTSRSTEAQVTKTTDVKLESLKDGEYKVPFTTLKPDSTDVSSMSSHIGTEAKLTVKDGVYTIELTTSERSNSMVTSIKTARNGELVEMDVVNGGRDTATRTVSAPITSLQGKLAANVSYEIPDELATNLPAGMPRVQNHDFDIVFGEPQLVKEQAPATGEVPVYVYKDGSNELSIMAGTYLSKTATVTAEGIDVVFPQGQYLKGFEVEGATVALKSEEVVDKNTVKIYTIETTDTSKIYTSTVHVKVNVPGVNYDDKYKVQLQFGGKQNPFSDIQKLANYSAIVSLYNKGIFKEADRYNPKDPTKRYQFALMLQRALDLPVPATTTFKDIAKLDVETQAAIKALNSYGVINGTTANGSTFTPGDGITREQTALMIYRLLVKEGYVATSAKNPFSDIKAGTELEIAAAELNALNIMNGYKGKLSPKDILNRDQMAKVLNNTLQVLEGLK